MSHEGILRVAVIGGFYATPEDKESRARATAEEIGKHLAEAGFGLVVYFSDDKSLEPHVVKGYSAAASSETGKILVRHSQNQRGIVKFDEQDDEKLSKLFDKDIFPSEDWEAPFYRSLADEDQVDAVLLMAGGTSTLIAGQIALARGLPVLAVDEFGGAAEKIRSQIALADGGASHPAWGTDTVSNFVQRLKANCLAIRKQKRAEKLQTRLYATVTSRLSHTLICASAFGTLLAILFFGLQRNPSVDTYSYLMFGAAIAAGATGALVRLVMWDQRERDSWSSLVLGAIAGFVVGAAYLIPQLIGAPGIFSATETVVKATDKIQFVSTVLVAISAGVGFDTIFSRLERQAESVEIAPS